ncbi:sensor histidine kinase [Brevibacterium zhoupengii]|uniref:sensor histidine kinase n=1 Tax=Brevibacterium zhoupengii TaxID=2898795 RepID=UPI001E4C7702|nr:histidine kinase [Brevibacterium zhoupengii]
MSAAPASTESTPVRLPFIKWFFPAIWMVFLVYPLSGAWEHSGASRYWGVGLTILFAAVFYLAMWVSGLNLGAISRDVGPRSTPASHRVMRGTVGRRRLALAGCLVAMIIIGLIVTALIGEEGLSFLAYISVIIVIIVHRTTPGLIVACLTTIVAEVTQHLVPGWTHDYATTFGISISSFAMVMAILAGDRARAARAAEEENRRLEHEAERLRISRDVHDVLGHSLTVIALKAQLAAKLQANGAPEAAKHISEIEQLARSALADVRTTVQGTRMISLAAELVAATRALRAAGIDVEAPTSVDNVDAGLRELFAWTVREGSTNIFRHARARHVSISLEPNRIEIRNDSVGHPTDLAEVGAGSGLRGLSERAKAVGARVRTEKTDEGFVLAVSRKADDAITSGINDEQEAKR